MTTLMVVDGNRGESRSVAVARRLREELAGRRVSISEVARRIGTTQQKLSRRMTGLTAWDVDELDEVCQVAGVSFDYVTTGIREVPSPRGPGGDGGSRLGESNSRPSHYKATNSGETAHLSPCGEVIPLRRAKPVRRPFDAPGIHPVRLPA